MEWQSRVHDREQENYVQAEKFGKQIRSMQAMLDEQDAYLG